MDRYGRLTARWYDLLSGEPVYGVGRALAVAALRLRPGDRVLDLGCGTGLNLPLLVDAVGRDGAVVGLDLSPAMLARARRRTVERGGPQVDLVVGDAARVPDVRAATQAGTFDAVICTYALSLMGDVGAVWEAVRQVLRPGAGVAVADLARPTGAWAWTGPAAVVACRLGGADIDARPWELLEGDLVGVRRWSRRGGHVEVRVGTL